MSESSNEKIIAEFRDNAGHVGGNFEGSPLACSTARVPRAGPAPTPSGFERAN